MIKLRLTFELIPGILELMFGPRLDESSVFYIYKGRENIFIEINKNKPLISLVGLTNNISFTGTISNVKSSPWSTEVGILMLGGIDSILK